MADWATISSLATAGGTLALAGATYAAVRSGARATRVAELTLQEQRRPVLVASNDDDRTQTIRFADDVRLEVPGGGGEITTDGGAAYVAVSLRNIGSGIAVLQAWNDLGIAETDAEAEGEWRKRMIARGPADLDDFRTLMRDQYIPSGTVGLWQGAVRDPADPALANLAAAAADGRPYAIDLHYTDQVGGQRTVSRLALRPEEDGWRASVVRHWYLDADAPR